MRECGAVYEVLNEVFCKLQLLSMIFGRVQFGENICNDILEYSLETISAVIYKGLNYFHGILILFTSRVSGENV